MAEVTPQGPTASDVAGMIAAAVAALPTSFLENGAPMTVASLLATYPPSASYLGKFARVSDLYGSVDETVRCRFDGANYRWVPQRSDYAGTIAATGGTVNVVSLVSAPIMRISESVASAMTLALPTANTYIGQQYRFQRSGILNLLGVNISNIVGGGTIPLLTGGNMVATLFPTGWQLQ